MLAELRDIAQEITGKPFNALVLQFYRDGQDGVGWHSDDDVCVEKHPTLVSMSFGESRGFWVRHKTQHDERYKFELHHGDLLVMCGDMQEHYVHKVPKEKDKGPRINLTFRYVVN